MRLCVYVKGNIICNTINIYALKCELKRVILSSGSFVSIKCHRSYKLHA